MVLAPLPPVLTAVRSREWWALAGRHGTRTRFSSCTPRAGCHVPGRALRGCGEGRADAATAVSRVTCGGLPSPPGPRVEGVSFYSFFAVSFWEGERFWPSSGVLTLFYLYTVSCSSNLQAEAMLVLGGSLPGFWVATPRRRVEEKRRVRPRARHSDLRVWTPAGARGRQGLCTPEALIRGGGQSPSSVPTQAAVSCGKHQCVFLPDF